MKTSETCQNKQPRRRKIREHLDSQQRRDLNGLDFVEISDDQLTITAYFLGKAPENIQKENVRIDGGRRVRNIRVVHIRLCRLDDPELDDCLKITVDRFGDFSTYTLRLVEVDESGRPGEQPLKGFDPRYAQLDFSFKAGCPSNLDCLTDQTCPPSPLPEPEINYLAKDYASFRQLILDRLSVIMPDWQERHVPDFGIALVELLAYIGDYLSYYQDAVATEAYLETARQRISVRRHARLIDYRMHEGCNARTWVFIEVASNLVKPLEPEGIYFITGHERIVPVDSRVLWADDLRNIPSDQYTVFEPMTRDPISLYVAHNEISFYTWGDQECCLPRGATTATLKDEWVPVTKPEPTQPPYEQTPQQSTPPKEPAYPEPKPSERPRRLNLQKGDVLIFEEVKGPKTGEPTDADPTHRHAVRLIHVEPGVDALYNQPVLEIEWAAVDALPFPLCLSAVTQAPACCFIEDISIARGNLVLVDHGRRMPDEPLGTVPRKEKTAPCSENGCPPETTDVPGWFRPRLQQVPLTFSQPLLADGSASELLRQEPREALPQIRLKGIRSTSQDPNPAARPHASGATRWMARRDLLGSDGQDYHFVVEIDNEGYAHLRFGDGELGRAPESGMAFTAKYRVGNGPSGNVGMETLSHIVFRTARRSDLIVRGVRNPLPAQGGTPPESLAEVKLYAPHAIRSDWQRAITAADYARLAQDKNQKKIQRAAAILRWTGSWYGVQVAVDPFGSEEADEPLLAEVARQLERYRRIGHDLVVKPARYVPLELALTVCVLPHYLRAHVEAALLDLFSNGLMRNGQPGFFHPDNLTFGEGIYLSKIVAAAQSVTGVESVQVTTFNRLFEEPNHEIERGILPLGPLEIAQLDNDPNFPEHGTLVLDLRGGR